MSKQESDNETDLEQRVIILEKKLDAAFKRIETLEDQLEDDEVASNSPAGVDHFDAAVLEHLDPGDTVSLQDLRRLYQNNTRITSEKTVKSRIKVLTKRSEFEYVRSSTWRYLGDGGEDGE